MTDKPHHAAIDVNGAWYLRDAKGALVPIETVKPVDLLIDELVHKTLAQARYVSAMIAEFKQRTFESVGQLQALLAQDYDAKIGGKKGNITLPAYDGCAKIQVAVADQLEFGPELQVAKSLIDDCLREWSAESRVEIRALVDRVFAVDKEGQISHAGLFMLLRVEISDDRWKRAMEAIRDSMRVIGSRTYLRFYDRSGPDAPWHGVPLDIANA
ncbi:DUF3164 family protein [Sphingomonas melonis]|uniref:Sulfate transporter n=1 Tax=Sphingomonas melonis TaxID=152682 RepID=A0A7Y9FQ59_9SPHN|nr:DUF3164 family protein [Sphingomonas melonis]NYD91410.1 hypothetical protein [Sphingomonas melonis]